MKFYIVAFNRKASASYAEFHAEFVAHPSIARWSHYIRSSYVVGTKLTASEISKHFRSVAAKYDLPQRHLVIRIDLRDRSGFLPHKAWEWMRKQLDDIE